MKLKPRPKPQPAGGAAPSASALPKGFSKVSLGDLGANLPIGVPGAGGKLIKPFALKRWTMVEEVEAGRLKKRGKGMGQFVSDLLSVFCTEVAGQKIQEMSKPERDVFFRSLYIPDVLYMYVYLRRMAKGPLLPVRFACPACEQPIDMDGDLDGLDVVIVDELDAIRGEFELTEGITYGGKLRKKARTELARWSFFEAAQGLGEGDIKRAMLEGSIAGLEGVKAESWTPLPSQSFDTMPKNDIDGLMDYISARTPGPQLMAEATCPNKQCGVDVMSPLHWQYDAFFETSSPSGPPRT